jgi:hypothetical protein
LSLVVAGIVVISHGQKSSVATSRPINTEAGPRRRSNRILPSNPNLARQDHATCTDEHHELQEQIHELHRREPELIQRIQAMVAVVADHV